ncbi:unnamed protein product [Didymodactylos carnosus]|uniref:MATH domain-containing protein n=1 Tax=Didymodactylos carnosus TaxID=1234261 RepID=A0A814HN71_9BILA|nr:unnamed protein product [Didymodactylos carnosus]CAF1011910.1 unnamed protein product [Didymodactylos carnosus]CAF1049003.1 unnamed protein product [Didymodactylos carnosus]CAF3783272.1 unnamed protein product [Didymodactylos carnosus]CAF3783291.1 unnamed protein product [Didymodactylos carnosus]
MEPPAMEYETMEVERLNTVLNATTRTSTLTQINELHDEFQKVYDILTILTEGVQTLWNDSTRLNEELSRASNISQVIQNELSQLKLSIKDKGTHLSGITSNQKTLEQQLLSIKQIVDENEFVSRDGTLMWKIINVTDKMADAQSGRQTSIYSPPFYSSPAGYKMRVRLDLHGDGNGRGTHMSVFFILMRGDFDLILKWPFNHKVTFCLFDQSGQNEHIIDSFRLDTKSNSFQRPHSEMNIASGISKFFPLSMIQQDDSHYVRDDTMFIKVIINFADLPEMILPYALTFNPGLPSHVQQHLVTQEIHKRAQTSSMMPIVSLATSTS